MILIYPQKAIDYMYKLNPEQANIKFVHIENEYGKPEIKDFYTKDGDYISYYKFELEDEKKRKRKKK